MKIFLILVFFLTISISVYFFFQGRSSKNGQALGMIDGKLAPCPDKPNSVCTEYFSDTKHYMPSLSAVALAPEFVMSRAAEIITSMGGQVTVSQGNYLAATFTRKPFGFVDDFELRLDTRTQNLHIRSASRVGRFDMNANRKRVQVFTDIWNT